MKKRYIEIIKIILIFIIIVGMGITTVFAKDTEQQTFFNGLKTKAKGERWNQETIDEFLAKYGGFPNMNSLTKEIKEVWRQNYQKEYNNKYELGEMSQEEWKNAKVPVALEEETETVTLSDERLQEAVEDIKEGYLTMDEWYWIAEQQSPGSSEQNTALDNAAEATANFVNEMNVVNKKIYKQPSMNEPQTSSGSLSDMMNDANAFVSAGNEEVVSGDDLQGISNVLYNILLEVGITIAVIVGGIIGIKFMMASVEEKAQYKELLVPYVVGCIIVFGSFAIWKIAVTLFANI